MNEKPALFYLPEPRFGCMQPVREGDLLRVKRLGYDWILEGKVLLVMDMSRTWDTGSMLGQDEVYAEVEEIRGIVDGVMQTVRLDELELLDEAR